VIYIYIYELENLFGTVLLMDGKSTEIHDSGGKEIALN
jgi:hypothetical protein